MDLLEKLLAREKIRDLLNTYCHGIDCGDWDLVRSCFGEGHVHSHASFEGDLDQFIGFASGFHEGVSLSHHSITNAKIKISDDGKSARCQSNFIAFHIIEDGKLEGMSFPSNGQGTDWTVAGRYIDDLECRDGGWLIVRRQAFNELSRKVPI